MKKIKITGCIEITEPLTAREIEVSDEEYEELKRLQDVARLSDNWCSVDELLQGIVVEKSAELLSDCVVCFEPEGEIEFCSDEDEKE
jgi:hypothetical protein